MDTFTDKFTSLPLPIVVSIIAILTAVRVSWRGDRAVFFRYLTDIVETVLIALIIVFMIVRPFCFLTFHIPTGSMRPTLEIDDRIIVNRLAYRFEPVRYGDPIVFRAPLEANQKQKEFIKRVVGLPGDLIEVTPGSVHNHETSLTHSELRAILLKNNVISSDGEPLRFDTDGIWTGQNKLQLEEINAFLPDSKKDPYVISPGTVLRNGVPLSELYIREDPDYRESDRRVPPRCVYVLGDNRNDSHDSHSWGFLSMDRIIGRADFVYYPLSRYKQLR